MSGFDQAAFVQRVKTATGAEEVQVLSVVSIPSQSRRRRLRWLRDMLALSAEAAGGVQVTARVDFPPGSSSAGQEFAQQLTQDPTAILGAGAVVMQVETAPLDGVG